jgi:hypothetical protein
MEVSYFLANPISGAITWLPVKPWHFSNKASRNRYVIQQYWQPSWFHDMCWFRENFLLSKESNHVRSFIAVRASVQCSSCHSSFRSIEILLESLRDEWISRTNDKSEAPDVINDCQGSLLLFERLPLWEVWKDRCDFRRADWPKKCRYQISQNEHEFAEKTEFTQFWSLIDCSSGARRSSLESRAFCDFFGWLANVNGPAHHPMWFRTKKKNSNTIRRAFMRNWERHPYVSHECSPTWDRLFPPVACHENHYNLIHIQGLIGLSQEYRLTSVSSDVVIIAQWLSKPPFGLKKNTHLFF